MGKKAQRRIVFANRKGGSGKTVTSVNVAAGLALAGNRVLLVDCDPQAHSSLSLGLSPYTTRNTLYDLLAGSDSSLKPFIKPLESPSGLAVLPASGQLAAYELEHSHDPAARSRLATLLLSTRETADFDYILLDVPPNVGLLTIMAMVLAREIIIPMQTHFLAMEGLAEMVRFVYQINATLNPDLVISGIVPTFYTHNTKLGRRVLQELEKNFGPEVILPPVRQNINLAEAPSFGQSIFAYAPSSHGAKDYQAIVARLEKK